MNRRRLKLSALILCGLLLAVVVLPCVVMWRQEKRNQALIAAIKASDTPKVLALLQAGADPNARDLPVEQHVDWQWLLDRMRGRPASNNSPTALVVAVEQRIGVAGFLPETPRIVQALLGKGADVNATGPYWHTPLLMIFEARRVSHAEDVEEIPYQNVELVKLLLDAGANTEAKDSNGETALMFAAYYGYRDSVRLLLDKGADVNAVAPNRTPGTPLAYAKLFGHQDIVKTLLVHGARK